MNDLIHDVLQGICAVTAKAMSPTDIAGLEEKSPEELLADIGSEYHIALKAKEIAEILTKFHGARLPGNDSILMTSPILVPSTTSPVQQAPFLYRLKPLTEGVDGLKYNVNCEETMRLIGFLSGKRTILPEDSNEVEFI